MKEAHLNPDRRVGCEFEMTFPLVGRGTGSDVQNMLANILTANGIPAVSRSYQHSPVPQGKDVCVEYDASIRGDRKYQGVTWYSVEVKTRILNGPADWESVVPRMLEICRYMGGRVNKSTGFHTHVDLPEVADKPAVIRSLYNLIHRFEPVIYGMMAPSRRQNGYSRPLNTPPKLLHGCNSIRSMKTKLQYWDRRRGLNLTHLFSNSPRVEFRYHQGTLDANKARMWMYLLNRLVQHACDRSCQANAEQIVNDRKGLDNFRYCLGLRSHPGIYGKVSDELKECSTFWLKRWKHFNAQQSD